MLCFHSTFTEICSLESNWHISSIDSDNALAPIRLQAILWSIAGLACVTRLVDAFFWTTLRHWNHIPTWWGTYFCEKCSLKLWHHICYEVRDLFPWEILTKMAISYLLNVEIIWNSAHINLSSTWNLYQKYFFDATISTEKSTREIDADLAQNEK